MAAIGGPLSKERQLALLKCGAERWNVFRREYSGHIVLYCASLEAVQLAGADLHCVLLPESNLREANLAGAILERAILRKSDFRGTDFRRAVLDGADLCRADLSGADLRGASMASTFLKKTNLAGADLSTACGLTAAQIGEAYGDDLTRLPGGFARPASWTTTMRLVRAVG